jgi:hypothetical protein
MFQFEIAIFVVLGVFACAELASFVMLGRLLASSVRPLSACVRDNADTTH